MRSKKRSSVFLTLGFLFVFVGLGYWFNNYLESQRAGKEASEMLEQLEGHIASRSNEIESKNLDLIDVNGMIGILSIPSKGIQLPVKTDYSLEAIKTAPAQYRGEQEEFENFVIAGHNYSTHFRELKNMAVGDKIIFTDTYGKENSFSTVDISTIAADDFEALRSGNWDVALFTCTLDSTRRIVVYGKLD